MWSFSAPCFPAFSLYSGKQGPEKLRIGHFSRSVIFEEQFAKNTIFGKIYKCQLNKFIHDTITNFNKDVPKNSPYPLL